MTNVPATITNVIALTDGGGGDATALDPVGTVVSWGSNAFATPPDLTNVVGISGGPYYSLAVRNDGTVASWPGATMVPTGVSNALDVAAALNVVLLENGRVVGGSSALLLSDLSNVVQIVAGQGYYALALLADGTLTYRENSSYSPPFYAPPPEGLSNIVSIAGGLYHYLALTRDGRVLAFGNDYYGEGSVPQELSNVVAISVGGYVNLALKSDGTVRGWGYNTNGAATPPPGLNNVAAVYAGQWTDASFAILGQGPPVVTSRPASVSVFSGSPALLRSAAVGAIPISYQWRHNGTNVPNATNSFLMLDNAATSDAGSYLVYASNTLGVAASSKATLTVLDGPPTLTELLTNTQAYHGKTVTFTARATGSRPLSYQWQHDGVILPGAINSSYTIAAVTAEGAGQYSVTITNRFGSVFESAVLSFSEMVGWYPELYPPLTPSNVVVAQIISQNADNWYIGLQRDGSLFGWDSLGLVASFPSVFTNLQAIAVGRPPTPYPPQTELLGLRTDGTVVGCLSPAPVFTLDPNVPTGLSNVVSVAAGAGSCFALRSDGTVAAWGSTATGPAYVPAGLSNVVDIAAGDNHALALREDGTVIAWGDNQYGQTNVPGGLSNVVAISADRFQSRVLLQNGTAITWPGSSPFLLTPPPLNGVAELAEESVLLTVFSNRTAGIWAASTPVGLTEVWSASGISTFGYPQGLVAGVFLAGETAPFLTASPRSTTIGGGEHLAMIARATGSLPLNYQWQRDGLNLPGATESLLRFTNAQAPDGGNYTVVVSNQFGAITSSVASLIVTGSPPVISSQPVDATGQFGGTSTFTISARGSLPFQYQWQFNGLALSGATNPVLTLSNLVGSNSGDYSVVISNSFGVAISSNASLTVLIPLDQSLNTTGVVWKTSGNAAWFGQSFITHDGIAAAQSGHIGNSQESVLQTYYVGPASVSFWWKVSSELYYDTLSFSIGTTTYTNISGEVDWQQQTFAIPAGLQSLQWVYSKDPNNSAGQDSGWLDQVTFAGGSPPPLLTAPALESGSFTASVPTIGGKNYFLEYKNSLTDPAWTLADSILGDGTTRTLSDTNAIVLQRFYRLRQSN